MDLSGLIAFGSGILSFFSPCVLPLIPSYLIFISGISVDNYNEVLSSKYRKNVLIHSIAFVLGFSFVFMTLGFSSSFIGNILSSYQTYIVKAGGLILIVMGLFYLNIIKIPILNQEKVIQLKEKPIGIFGSFIVGITFSLGWTPCIGPALSSILIIASPAENFFKGVYLLGLYSLGMAIPFLISSLLCNRLLDFLKRYGHLVRYSMKILGILLIIVGLLLITSYFGKLSLVLGQALTF
jgi:cytochrome c-type biogenesis protein